MKKSSKILSILLSALMVSSVLAGCGADSGKSSTPSKATDSKPAVSDQSSKANDSSKAAENTSTLAYKGKLSLMHFSTSEESKGNGGSDGFRTMIDNWKKANPDIQLEENVLANADYKPQIATLAAANDLPDVFLLQGMDTKSWAKQNLIMDMTDIIKASPYYNDYNQSYFVPFTDNNKLYGLPALTGGTCTVIVYDKAAWEKAGFKEFPKTWEEVKTASEKLKANGFKDAIAFGNGGKWQINSCFQSVMGNRFTGSEWFQSIVDKKGAKFTDPDFVASLKFTQDLFADDKIFNNDFNAITNEDAREYFIAGTAAAFIGGNWDASYIMATLKDDKADAYKNIGFAVLPQPDGAKGPANSQNIGLGYAIGLNSKLSGDKDKLDAGINFAEYATGPDFASFVNKKYALGGLTKVANVDLSAFDQITQDFYNYSYVDTTPCEIYDSYVAGAVWDVFNTEAQTMLNGGTTPDEVAAKTQAAYEANY